MTLYDRLREPKSIKGKEVSTCQPRSSVKPGGLILCCAKAEGCSVADLVVVDTGTDDLLARTENGVLVITLNRPERRNALSQPMLQALGLLLKGAARDQGVRALLLTGAGGAFCGGGDVRGMNERQSGSGAEEAIGFEASIEHLRADQAAVIAALFELPIPAIAAVPGAVAGGGMGLALACDLRIAAESAFLTTAFANLGFSGDYGGSWLLTQIVGTARARELYYFCERIDAAECKRLGIFSRVVADHALMDEAFELAVRLARGPSIAFGYMKENLNRALTTDFRTALNAEAFGMGRSSQTEDHRNAVKAFVEKTKPTFNGR
jgi:2-(1,2-epoxy-1,2-dihydrophenyl)acetyl-CoA isomerase